MRSINRQREAGSNQKSPDEPREPRPLGGKRNDVSGGFSSFDRKPFSRPGFGRQPFVTDVNHRRCSTARAQLYAGFDAQVFGDALEDNARVPRRGIAVAVEHPVKGLFTQPGLPRQFLKTNFGVDGVAQYGKPKSGFTLQKAVNPFRVKRPRKFGFTLYPRYDRFGVISCRNHFHAITGCNAARGWTSRSMVRAFVWTWTSRRSAAFNHASIPKRLLQITLPRQSCQLW
jgi:hypothetical protein